MHRDYETNAPIQFYEYDDRIEIQNPGGLYGKVSPENFPNVSDYRNPFIAEAMKILGYVNRFSRGVYRVQKELTENGNEKAEFDFSFVTAFRVIEKASKRYYDAGFGAERNPQETHKKPTRNPLETPQNIRERIIYEIQKNPAISGRELEALLGRTSNSIKHCLLQMNKEGIISHEGPTKGGRWVVLKK